MDKGYNLYNLEASFKEFLLAGNQKPVSIKNYLSDFRHFAGWMEFYLRSHSQKQPVSTNFNQFQLISINTVSEYRSYLIANRLPVKTINRRLSTLRKFCSFCISQGWLKENPAKLVSNMNASESDWKKFLPVFESDLLKKGFDKEVVSKHLADVKEFFES